MPTSAYYQCPRREVVAFIEGHPHRILEIGCGNGAFRANISWPNVYSGVELCKDAAQAASKVLDRVWEGNAEKLLGEIPAHSFDLIVCNDVIEHLPDTAMFLAALREKLDRGGQLVGSVPNVRFFVHIHRSLASAGLALH